MNTFSPIASASASAPRLHPLQLLFPDCVRFSCCSLIASASAAAPRFSFCSSIASTSASAPRLRPLQLLLPDCSTAGAPYCVRFSFCSPIASLSAAAPRLCPIAPRLCPPKVLEHVRFGGCKVQRSCAHHYSILPRPPKPQLPLVTHTCTHTHT